MLFPTEKFFEKEQRLAFLTRLLRKVFLDDWLMKLIALVITLALWLGVSGLREPITTPYKGIPLTLRFSNEVDVTNSPVTEVDIVVTGDKSKIKQINKENLIVSLDLTEVQPGERIVQLTPENVSVELPTGVKLEEIQPSKIAVKLEKVMEREVPVKAETEGSTAEGFEIYSAVGVPPNVRVRGPESSIRPLDSVSTEKINIEGRQEDFTAQQVSLNVINPKVRPLDTAVVDIFFRIGEKRIEKIYLVPVKTENVSKTATVILYGVRSIFENLRSDNLKVELVRNEAGENSLRLVLPAEIQDKVEIRKLKIN
ncbi:MAG: CdaR family protein [Actinomycetota bacterium]